MAYGTFLPDSEGGEGRRYGVRAYAVAGLLAAALVAVVVLGRGASGQQPAVMVQQARQQQLAWSGFTYQMQEEANKALRLCSIGLMGKNKKCAKHVVPTKWTKYTNSDEGQNVWEESQRELNRQSSVVPQGKGGIGTPGDDGDRR